MQTPGSELVENWAYDITATTCTRLHYTLFQPLVIRSQSKSAFGDACLPHLTNPTPCTVATLSHLDKALDFELPLFRRSLRSPPHD